MRGGGGRRWGACLPLVLALLVLVNPGRPPAAALRPGRGLPLSLRGGKQQKGARGGLAARARAGAGRGPVDLRKRLQAKLTALDARRKMLDGYSEKWAAEQAAQEDAPGGDADGDEDADGGEDVGGSETGADSAASAGQDQATDETRPEMARRDAGAPSRAGGASASSPPGPARGAGPDALLRELQRSGLCPKGALDSRVETFMVKLKREGKRAALVAALSRFREHLLRPQSRSRSAVLHCTVLCFTVLCHTILYCTLYAILYIYTILH